MGLPPENQDRRTEPRYRVDMPVTLRAYRQPPVSARMEDVSKGGALVALDAGEIARGDEVLLDLGWSEFVVTVAWTTDGFVGVIFHRPLRAFELDGIRRRGRGRA